MQVPLLNLKAQYVSLREEMRDAIQGVMESQQFVLGNEVRNLESAVAYYSNTKQAIGCASGTDALLLALMALDVKPGDEVITTSFTFFATGSAIARAGARPVFVDIHPETYNLDTTQLAAAISANTRAILPVHLYGQCVEMEPILAVAEQKGLPVIEDCAQAIGAEDRGRRAGSMGLAGCFSFYPTKNLGGAGDGGIITTKDDQFAQRVRRLRVHGGLTEYEHIEVGLNSRLDELQAAVLNVKMKYLDDWSNRRAELATNYTRLIEGAGIGFEVVTPFVREDGRHIFHQYVIRVPQHRDALMMHLKECGVGTKVYYPIPLHLQPCFEYLGYKEGAYPETERAATETFALPMFPELTEDQQVYVVESIKGFRPA
jgi:dTDP-4-amino-4,6-dideoxygalactose transaminase